MALHIDLRNPKLCATMKQDFALIKGHSCDYEWPEDINSRMEDQMKKRGMVILAMALLGLIVMTQGRATQDPFPVLRGPYLGQKTPGMTPEVFAPGIISTGSHERSLVFAPAMDELFFELRGLEFTTLILTMKIQNEKWSRPEVAYFSGIPSYSDDCPFIASDGKRMFFVSKRPLPGSGIIKEDTDLWILTKNQNGWGRPEQLGPIVNSEAEDDYPSVSKRGNVYFTSNRDGNFDIFVSKDSDSGFSQPIRLPSPVNSEHYEGHPFIAADESYLIFSSDRPGQLGDVDLYISFKKKDQGWTEPVNMGEPINSPSHEVAPYVSPDGQFLFFCSFRSERKSYLNNKFNYNEIKSVLNGPGNGNGDIFWVSAKIIDALRPKK